MYQFCKLISLPFTLIFIGENGTIDGQGDVWWNMWRQRTLQFTRPNLVEFLNSRNIIISNVIFKNSPFWNIHPVYCRYKTLCATNFCCTIFIFLVTISLKQTKRSPKPLRLKPYCTIVQKQQKIIKGIELFPEI